MGAGTGVSVGEDGSDVGVNVSVGIGVFDGIGAGVWVWVLVGGMLVEDAALCTNVGVLTITVGVLTATDVAGCSSAKSSIARNMAAKTIKAMTMSVPMPIAMRLSGDELFSSEEKLSDEDTVLPHYLVRKNPADPS